MSNNNPLNEDTTNKIRGAIIAKYGSVKEFCEKEGLSTSLFYGTINGKRPSWKVIDLICREVSGISKADFPEKPKFRRFLVDDAGQIVKEAV